MPNVRSIPPEMWAEVFATLITFFRYKGSTEPEDDAQRVLLALFRREDYEFRDVADIKTVARAFARNIGLETYRRRSGKAEVALDFAEALAEPPDASGGAEAIETRIFIEEVLRIAKKKLRLDEMEVLRDAISGRRSEDFSAGERNKRAVMLFRIRQKLGKIIRGVIPDE